ncbi:unnamed protein product [Caenorhabditis sp. 36 PRJEB53466]|nr:unnamed protein product [Caenorhabditis sp. 36 PRJEB53466]
MLFGSPASLRKANESFNESFGDKNTLSPTTLFRCLQKEHDQISSILRFQPPTPSQYQNSLIELISLFERAEEQSTIAFQKLIVSVFLKLCANILNALAKPKHQPLLYKLSQLIADSIVPDLGPENEIEEKTMKKWADRVVIESSIHLLDFTNYQLDIEFSIDSIVDDMGLANGRFQFVKSSIFEAARDIISEMPSTELHVHPETRFAPENLADEPYLRLILWLFIRQKPLFTDDFLRSLFPTLSDTPSAQDIVKSPCSLLDVKLYVVSLSVVAATTTDSGITFKSAPTVSAHLSLTKHQKDCWRAVVDASAGLCSRAPTALSRLRTAQLLDSVRLTSDGSEDVRVLFEAWKCCLQPSAAHDKHVSEAIKVLTEKYRTKMNNLLAYGPFYSTDPSSFVKSTSSGSRRDLKTLFPLQFDYEFVDTTEAGHIGVVINSLEGYHSVQNADEDSDEEDGELEVGGDSDNTTFHSFRSDNLCSSADNSQFFSPLKHNRQSMCPSAISQLIRDESAANSSHFSTQSLILTPTRKGPKSPGVQRVPMLTFELPGLQNVSVVNDQSKKEEEEVEDESEDELEKALLESSRKYEEKMLKQSPAFPIVSAKTSTPMKDAQTDTDDVISSEESSIVSVRYTPRRPVEKEAEIVAETEEEEEEYESEEESEEEEEDDEMLNESETEAMMEQILEGITGIFRDHRMKQFGIQEQKIATENVTDSEMLAKAEEKLSKISCNMQETMKRLEALQKVTTYTTFIPKIPSESLKSAVKREEHNPKKCLGCQDDEIQEAALRCLEQLALDWDAEGNDYLYE